MADSAVIGVWSAAQRRKVRIIDAANDDLAEAGPWVQVSRLGNPLFNEVIVGMGHKDEWNTQAPAGDVEYLPRGPEAGAGRAAAGPLPRRLPQPRRHQRAARGPRRDPADGDPVGDRPGFQNYTGPTFADQLRLNMAIPPSTANPNRFGLLGGDAAGFPNGRRVFDDIVSIELRAIAGLTYPLVDKGVHAGRRSGPADAGPRAGAEPLPGGVPLPWGAAERLRRPVELANHVPSGAPGAARRRRPALGA